jgi:hypothetical protein
MPKATKRRVSRAPPTPAAASAEPAFARFSKLSAELRCKIWQQVALEHFQRLGIYSHGNLTAIAIDIVESPATAKGRRTYVDRNVLQQLRCHALSGVNCEARSELTRAIMPQNPILALDYRQLQSLTMDELPNVTVAELRRLMNRPSAGRAGATRKPILPFGSDLPKPFRVTRLAMNMTFPGYSHKYHRIWRRFMNPTDFLSTLNRLFGPDVERVYLYDSHLGGPMEACIRSTNPKDSTQQHGNWASRQVRCMVSVGEEY